MLEQMVQLSIICTQCNNSTKRPVQLIAPEDFAEGKEPVMISSFWCPHCKNPQVVRLRFSRTESGEIKVEEEAKLQPTSAFVASPGAQGITITAKCRSSKKVYNKNE